MSAMNRTLSSSVLAGTYDFLQNAISSLPLIAAAAACMVAHHPRGLGKVEGREVVV